MLPKLIFNLNDGYFEPTLSLDYADLMNEVCWHIGQGADYTIRTAAEQAVYDRFVASGMRRFYQAYDWSFLRKVTTFTTTADDYDMDLPDDFGDLVGSIQYDINQGDYEPIASVGDWQIQHWLQESTTSGRPRHYAVRPLSSTGARGQRFELLLYPPPDAAYTCYYKYKVRKNRLTTSNPYPHGGVEHSETIKLACLVAATKGADDEGSVHETDYAREMGNSIIHDKKVSTPDMLGYNPDNSDNLYTRPRGVQYAYYNGQLGES